VNSDPFALFIERDEIIKAFDRLVSEETPGRILLVNGLSGTGKSFLIDWLRSHHCRGIPSAKLTFAPSFQETDLLRSLAAQLDAKAGQAFAHKLDQLAQREQEHPLFNVPVSQSVEGRLGGSVSGADQSVTINLGDATAAIELQRRIQRMDALISSLATVDVKPWVLFLDETEHLAQPDLRRFILDELIPRLRTQCSNCRLYFSGQSVPTEAFSRHEVERLHLVEFTMSETVAIAEKAGLTDETQASRLYDQTAGHPLLVSMWLEDAMDRAEAGDIQFEETSAAGDEAERTRWIYDRIVSRFSDPVARKAAANLSLLEWFDLGLLRSVFDPGFSEAAFQQMVSRSFIKPLGGNRWRCHDMIRKHLPAQRRSLDPEEYIDVCRRAADAFLNRMAREEERAGTPEFPERLTYATAAMQSLLGFSLKRAEEFILRELARAAAVGTVEYLFALARYLERSADAAPFGPLVQDIRDLLESIGVLRLGPKSVDFLERLAIFSREQKELEVAALLFRYAGLFAMAAGSLQRAAILATQACEIDDGITNSTLLARCLARAGDITQANAIIDALRKKNGDSPELRMSEVKIARDRNDLKQAVRLLTELMTVYPDSSVPALMQLAELSLQADDLSAALKQTEAVLQREPNHLAALRLQSDILFAQGKVSQALALIARIRDTSANLISATARLISDLSQPTVRNRLLAQFKNDTNSVNPAVLLLIADTLALEGKVKEVEALTSEIERLWPETAEIISIKRAMANIKAGRPEHVPALLQPLADRGVFNIDLYAALADAYAALGKPLEQRKALERGMECVPGASDVLESWLVSSIAQTEGANLALRHLELKEQKVAAGPNTLLVKARLLNEAGRPDAAIDLLDQLIYTQDVESLPGPSLVAARIQYVALLAAKNRDKALEVLDNTVDLFPDNALAITVAARMFARIGDEQRLRRTLNVSKDRRPSTRMEMVMLLGHLVAIRLPNVPKLLEELEQHPDRLELIAALDVVLTRGNLSEAGAVFQQADRIAPGLTAEFLQLRSRTVDNLGGAIQQLYDAVKSNPTQIEYRIGLADVLRAHGSLDEAISVIDEFPNPTPDQSVLCTAWKARTLIEANRLDEAESLLTPYLAGQALPPAELMDVVGDFLGKKGNVDEQLQFYRHVGDSVPQLKLASKAQVIQLLLLKEEPAEALLEIEALAVTDRLPLGIQFAKVDALEGLDRFDDAMKYLDTISDLDRASKLYRAKLWTERAYIHRKQGRNEDAIDCSRQALEVDSDSIGARFQLARAYEDLGKIDLAYETFMDAVAVQPSLAVEYSERLRKLRDRMGSPKAAAT
jgi:tetratricopeptide (TPR) repeat protein